MATRRKSTATSAKESKMTPLDKQRKDFSSEEKTAIMDKLITARIGLLIRNPFFGNLVTRLELVDASDWCSTLATDGRRFYYSNDFVHRMNTREMEFGFAHEILHIVYDHMGRREHRDPKISNIAADFAVNQVLVDEKIGTVPSFINIFQDDKYRGLAYEEIYDDLMKNAVKINISSLGELFDDHLESDEEGDGDSNEGDSEGNGGEGGNAGKRPKLSREERRQIQEEIKNAVISAAQSAGAGNVPASIARMITALTEPKMDWRQLLRQTIQSVVRSDYSFARPNRRSQHCGAVLPGSVPENTIDVAVALDMSGSITEKQAGDFLSEVKGIMEEFTDFKLDLMCFDTQVYNFVSFAGDNAHDITTYEAKGGGGTDFTCVWDYLKEHGNQPKRLIMFTDMYPCGSWGDPDYCETLFIAHGTTSIVAPFGQTAYYD